MRQKISQVKKIKESKESKYFHCFDCLIIILCVQGIYMLKIWLIQGFILNLPLIIFIIWLIFMCKRFVCIFQMKQKNPESSKIKESKKWKYFNCFDYSFVYLLYFYLWRICLRGWKVQIKQITKKRKSKHL